MKSRYFTSAAIRALPPGTHRVNVTITARDDLIDYDLTLPPTPAQQIAASIRLGIMAEQDWDGPSIKPGALTEEQVDWLGSWLAGEGYTR
jgi:hypothetical protein